MKSSRWLLAAGVLAAGMWAGACNDGTTKPSHVHATATVALSQSALTLKTGDQAVLTAQPTCSCGQVLESPVTWTSSNPAIASVSGGTVTAVSFGTATITAAADGKTGTAALAIEPLGTVVTTSGGTVTSSDGLAVLEIPAEALTTATDIAVLPVADTAFHGDQLLLSGTGYEVRPAALALSKAATLRIGYDAAKLPTGTFQEQLRLRERDRVQNQWLADLANQQLDSVQHRVTAELQHGGTFALVVAVPSSVTITPSTLELETGDVVALTADVTDGSGTSINVPVTWSVSDSNLATITSTGNLTADVSAKGTGSITVSASAGSAKGSSGGSISSRVASVTVTLAKTSVGLGGSTVATAKVLDADGATLTETVTWTSSATNVATVTSTGATTATVSGVGLGTATISAKLRKITGSADVSVVPITSVTITSTSSGEPLAVGATLQLTAVANSSAGPVPATFVWASDNPAVASVDQTGLLTGVARGDANITAAVGSIVSAPVAIKVTGGETETTGNNLSWPIVFSEGISETMVIRPASTETAAFTELTAITPTNPTTAFWYTGNALDATYTSYYVQGTASAWRPQILDGTGQPKYDVEAAWGDNLAGDASLRSGHPIRIEVALSATAIGTLKGYNMTVLANASTPDEVQGTDGTQGDFIPLLYTPDFTFTIVNSSGTAVDPSTMKAMTAETNVGGRLVYGAQFTPAAAGDYTLRFKLGSTANATITTAKNGVVDSGTQSSITITVVP